MITPETITKPQAREILILIEQWTRAEVMARLAPLGWPDYGDYYREKLEKADEIRRLVFGTDELAVLGQRWHILKDPNEARASTKDFRVKKKMGYNKSTKAKLTSHGC